MEVAGLAIGVVGLAGLFNSCLESLARVQSYQSSKSDSHVLNTRFRASKTRFEQWGVSVGFLHGKLMQDHHSALDNQDIAKVVEDILRIITKTIIAGFDAPETKNIGALHHNEPYSTDLSKSRRKRLRWALGGKEEHIEQVDMFEKLVQQLHNLVPPNTEDNHADRLQGKAELEDLRQIIAKVEQEMQAEVRRDVFSWLGKSPPSDRYEDSISKRVDGTCDWIFERPTFISWLMKGNPSKPSVLWINGPAGFGKTFLCAHIVQHLSTILATPVAYFFFTSDNESRENPYLALRSWISQVAAHHDAAFECVREAWEVDLSDVSSRRTIIKLLKTVVDTVSGCTFVVDGLDECAHLENGDTSVAEFLSDIINTVSESNVKLLFISRDEPGIRDAIIDSARDYFAEYRIEPEDVRSDTATFSQSIVDRKLTNKSEDVRTAISEAMTARCEGQFLWLKMQEESLRKGMNKKRLQEVVENTPSGLDRLYDHNWARITDMAEWERDRVFALLRWAAFAIRPLTIHEITEAVLITQFEELDPEELPDTVDDDYVRTEVIGLCGPLLEVKQPPDTSSAGYRTVHIPHFSVRQYLLHKLPTPTWLHQNGQLQASYEQLQHTILSRACLQYISLPQVWGGEMKQRDSDSTFCRYAAGCWFSHVESSFQDPTIFELAAALFRDENPVYNDLARYLKAKPHAIDPDPQRLLTPLEYILHLEWADMANLLVTKSNVNKIGWGGMSPIFFACYAGTAKVVSKFLQVEADLTITDRYGSTPLHEAACSGSEDVIRILVDHGADISAQDGDGWTPLHIASQYDHVKACEYLIQGGSSLTISNDEGKTPLQIASNFGQSAVVELILRNGPKTMATDPDSRLVHPLHIASIHGHIETARVLLEYGARTSISVTDCNGWSPLATACYYGHTAMAKLLLDHGAEVTLTSSNCDERDPLIAAAVSEGDNDELVELLLSREAGSTISVNDSDGYPPLVFASRKGNSKVVRLLLQHQDRNFQSILEPINTTRSTPLFSASYNGHVEVIKELLNHGAEATIATTDANGETPLHVASRNGHEEIVKILLEHGARATITTRNKHNETPLFAASSSGRVEVVKHLLNHGAEATIATTDANGEIPLHVASRRGHIETVKHLLSYGAKTTIAIQDKDGETPLYAASQNDHEEVIKILLEHGARATIATPDKYNETPLYAASSSGSVEAMKHLLKYGAGATIVTADIYGQTPLYVAAEKNHTEVVKLLLDISPAQRSPRDHPGCTPLFLASRCGNHEVVALLLSTDSIDPDSTDWVGSSPLFAAVANGHLGVVKLLISGGVTINPWASIGQSLLWWARRAGNLELIQLLEAQEVCIEVPTPDAYTRYEPPPADASPVIFDSSTS
ncbi:hypothetical protein FSARC_11022, partial [Fusarium sarcochroum]